MQLSKGEVIEIKDDMFDFDFNEIEVLNIKHSKERGVFDITTETGFFQDSNGVLYKNCSAHSLRAIAMHGLGKFFSFDVKSNPAAHAQTLIGHLNTFMCTISSYYAGAIGIDAVNVYLAPYLEGMDKKKMKQIAQYLIFSLSQSAFSRGGQVLFSDLNLFISIPEWLKKIQAVGPRGELLTKVVDGETVPKTYSDYEKISREFLLTMLEVWKEGDACGAPMAFPKADLHVSDNEFKDPEAKKVLEYACEVASHNGAIYFIFDKDAAMLSACCRLRTKVDSAYLTEPERIRFVGFQNVSISLPQCAYRSGGDKKKFLSEIKHSMDLAMKAHLQKKAFISKLGSDRGSPLYPLLTEKYFDGEPYVDLEKATYIFGLVGLNEAVQFVYGKELHESEDAHEYGLDVITSMYLRLQQYKEKHGLNVVLEESPAESTARRLAKVDIIRYPESSDFVRGNKDNGDVFYTNSIHFRADSNVDIVNRIVKQSEFHPLIEAGAIIHLFVQDNMPSPQSIFSLVEKTYKNTECAQWCISPEFTICKSCSTTSYGLNEKCMNCGNAEVKHMSRVVGYYSIIENWNASKKEENQDRHKGDYIIKENSNE